MRRAGLFLLALAGLPLLWALGETLLRGLAADLVGGPLITPERIWFCGGALGMVALYLWKGHALMVIYVFAHEMTHALAGILCLARIHRVSVRETGGFVELSKSNLFITLAPYCVPFYLLIAVGLRALTAWLWPGVIPEEPWHGLFGVLTLFHILYTIGALLTAGQPDLHEYGVLFSCWLILCVNLFCASVALTLAGRVPPRDQAYRLTACTIRTYRFAWETLRVPIQFVRDWKESR